MNRQTTFLGWPGLEKLSLLFALPNIGIVLLMFLPIFPALDLWELEIPAASCNMLSIVGAILGLAGLFFRRPSRWLMFLALVLNILEIIFIPSFGRA